MGKARESDKFVSAKITEEQKDVFENYMIERQLGPSTCTKYRSNLAQFEHFAEGRGISKATLLAWKNDMKDSGEHMPSTINGKIAAVNAFFRSNHREDCTVSPLPIQKKSFREDSKALTRKDYDKLVDAAEENGLEKEKLVAEILGSMGVRASEVKYVTVEAVKKKCVTIINKGKAREVLIPTELTVALEIYAEKYGITSGPILLDKKGKPLDRQQIWAIVKRLAKLAEVGAEKAHPHNFRHLFALSFYEETHDLKALADLLGHSSISTTRLYIAKPSSEQRQQLDSLNLVHPTGSRTGNSVTYRQEVKMNQGSNVFPLQAQVNLTVQYSPSPFIIPMNNVPHVGSVLVQVPPIQVPLELVGSLISGKARHRHLIL